MSTVEIETGRYIKRWAFWNPATWSIPKLYWDAWSQEQRLHAICRQLEKVIKYADYLGVNVDDIAARLKAIEEGQLDDFIVAAIEQWFEEHEPEIWQALTELQNSVSDIVDEIGTGFDSENTIANAISNINNDILTINGNLEQEAYKTETYIKAHYLTETLVPQYVGDILIEQQHGCCCSALNHIYMFCSDTYDEGNGRIYIADPINNDYIVKSGISIGHANSCAHDPVRNCFWVAPMATYGSGVSVEADYAIKYDYNFTTRNILQFPESVFALSFDSITETMYFLTTDTATVNIYKMNSDENEPTLMGTIDYDAFVDFPAYSLQDLAVHNGTFFICRPNGIVHVFVFESGEFEQINTYKIGYRDAGDIIHYGEIEGFEFDENGLLYNARNYYYGRTKDESSQHYGLNDASVTVLSTADNIITTKYYEQRQILTCNLVSNSKFSLGRAEIRTLRQLNHFNMMNHQITVDADVEIDEMGLVTLSKNNLFLRVSGTYKCSGFSMANCQFGIMVGSTGTLIIEKPYTSAYAFDFTHRFNVFSFWNEGTLTLDPNITAFIWNGYGCSFIYIGNLKNIASVTVGSTQVTSNKFLVRNTILNP